MSTFKFNNQELDALRAYFRLVDAILAVSIIDDETAEKCKTYLNGTELSTWTLDGAHRLIDASRKDRGSHWSNH